MKILIACEVSGRLRDAFVDAGHDAWSCDLLATAQLPLDLIEPQKYPDRHIVGDAKGWLDFGWDMMIAHPPCTYLTNAGVRWLSAGDGQFDKDRWQKMELATDEFNDFLRAPIPKKAIENSVMHKYARARIDRSFDHSTQPHWFGAPEKKRACWWLEGLSPLKRTHWMDDGDITGRVHRESPGPWRWLYRSLLPPEMVSAIVQQWGG